MLPRKNYLINKKFQLNFLLKIIVLSLFNNIIFLFAINYFFNDLEKTGQSIGIPKNHLFFKFISHQYYELFFVVLLVSAFSTLFIFIFGLLMGHKIAGPMYRLKIEFESMAKEKRLNKLAFRKGDYFQEVQDSFNNLVEIQSKDNKV